MRHGTTSISGSGPLTKVINHASVKINLDTCEVKAIAVLLDISAMIPLATAPCVGLPRPISLSGIQGTLYRIVPTVNTGTSTTDNGGNAIKIRVNCCLLRGSYIPVNSKIDGNSRHSERLNFCVSSASVRLSSGETAKSTSRRGFPHDNDSDVISEASINLALS